MSYQVQYDFDIKSILQFFRKRKCPKCGKKMKLVFKTVDTYNSLNYNRKEFFLGRYFFPGDKIIKKPIYYCNNCSTQVD